MSVPARVPVRVPAPPSAPSCPPLRPRVAVRVVSVVLAAIALAVGVTGCQPRPTLAELDRKLYATSLSSFDRWWRGEQATANGVSRATIDRWLASSPRRLDGAAARARTWDVTTDLCSFAPDRGPVFDFRVPCIRHDFAWRNLRRIDRLHGGGVETRARRLAANRQFLRDMAAACATRPTVQRTSCGAVARTYFAAVSAVS